MSTAAVFFAACGGNAESGEAGEVASAGEGSVTYTIDSNSSVEWTAGHLMGIGATHNGTITLSDGTLNVEDGNITAGNFTIDMGTISVSDLTPETGSEKLVGHLGKPEFFDVQNYPTAKFEITGSEVKKDGDNTHVITGNLTLKDSTRSVSIPAAVSMDGDMITASGEVAINRLDWGINFHSKEQDMTEAAIKATENGIVDKVIGLKINLSGSK